MSFITVSDGEIFLPMAGVDSLPREDEPFSLEGRQIAVLIAEDSDADVLIGLIREVHKAGGHAAIIAPGPGRTRLSDNSAIMAEAELAQSSSQSFDAVALLLSESGAVRHRQDVALLTWLRESFDDRKAIGYSEGARLVLGMAGIVPVEGVVAISELPKAASQRYWHR
jgi:catalase